MRPLGGLSVDGRIILKLMLKKEWAWLWTGSS